MPHDNLGETVAIAVVFKCLGIHFLESFFCFFSQLFGAKHFWSVLYLGDLGDFKHFWWVDYPIWPQTYFQRAAQAQKTEERCCASSCRRPAAACRRPVATAYGEKLMMKWKWLWFKIHGMDRKASYWPNVRLNLVPKYFDPKSNHSKWRLKNTTWYLLSFLPSSLHLFQTSFPKMFSCRSDNLSPQDSSPCQGAFWSLYMGCCLTSRLVPFWGIQNLSCPCPYLSMAWDKAEVHSVRCAGQKYDLKLSMHWQEPQARFKRRKSVSSWKSCGKRVQNQDRSPNFDILQAPIVLNAFCAWCSSKKMEPRNLNRCREFVLNTPLIEHGSWKWWFSKLRIMPFFV